MSNGAYMRPLYRVCERHGCDLHATTEVFDRWDYSLGSFCIVHAIRITSEERERDRARREEEKK